MISKLSELIGDKMQTLKELILIRVRMLNLLIGKIWLSQSSIRIGIFVDNIPIQDIEGPYMEHIYQEKTQPHVLLVRSQKISGFIEQLLKTTVNKVNPQIKKVIKDNKKIRIKEKNNKNLKNQKIKNNKEKKKRKRKSNSKVQVQVKIHKIKKRERENKVTE